jgi:hypothetical protein
MPRYVPLWAHGAAIEKIITEEVCKEFKPECASVWGFVKAVEMARSKVLREKLTYDSARSKLLKLMNQTAVQSPLSECSNLSTERRQGPDCTSAREYSNRDTTVL